MVLSILERPRARLSAVRLGGRERALGLGLLLVLALIWAQAGYERLSTARAAAAQSEVRRQQVLAGQTNRERNEYRRNLRREATNVSDHSLQDPTIFLAQMRAQSQLQDFAIAAGMANVQIGLDAVEATSAPLQQLSLTVESAFTWRSLIAFLGSLASARTSYFVNAIDVVGVAPQQRVRVTLYVPYVPAGTRP